MPGRVTVRAIAEHSQTSPSTVSLVLRNRPGISEETRQRVLASARELGFRGLPSTASGSEPAITTIGLILRSRVRAGGSSVAFVNPFYAAVLSGVEDEARRQRISLLYAALPVDDDDQPLQMPTGLLNQSPGGLLIVGSLHPETVREIVGARTVPTVLVDTFTGVHDHEAIITDHELGVRTAIDHLIAHGHRRIAIVGPPQSVDPALWQRRLAAEQALRERGLESMIQVASPPEQLHDPLVDLLGSRRDVTAIFACNDQHAIAVLRAAAAAGRTVPGDLSVIGFDDIELASHVTPALTTMAVDKVALGRRAVNLLVQRATWPEAAAALTLLRPILIQRDSIAAVTPDG